MWIVWIVRIDRQQASNRNNEPTQCIRRSTADIFKPNSGPFVISATLCTWIYGYTVILNITKNIKPTLNDFPTNLESTDFGASTSTAWPPLPAIQYKWSRLVPPSPRNSGHCHYCCCCSNPPQMYCHSRRYCFRHYSLSRTSRPHPPQARLR
jgi:hypothetical protein